MARLRRNYPARYDAGGIVSASSRGTSVSNGAPANSKGNWVQLVSSSSYDCDAVLLTINNGSSTLAICSSLIDIGIGAASSEQVIIPDLAYASDQWHGKPGAQILIPCKIPAGTRIAARHACSDANIGLDISIHLMNLGMGEMFPLGEKIVSYGTASADSGGTSVDPGGTINTKGSYSQITASTNEDLKGIIICIGNQNLTKTSTADTLLDIATGGAGSEQVVIADMPVTNDTNSEQYQPIFSPLFPVDIPAGTRIAARCQSSINTATVRLYDVAILGIA